jgi:hypothetical protein
MSMALSTVISTTAIVMVQTMQLKVTEMAGS